MHVLLRGSPWQLARLMAGLVLLLFAVTHFLNHAMGLVSLDAMTHMQEWRIAVTRSWPGTIILAVALVVHIALGLARLAVRRTWRMPTMEAVQIISGLIIPLLLFKHIAGTRIADLVLGADDSYGAVLPILWLDNGLTQSALLLLVWAHACIGMHLWLRLAPWYRLLAPLLVVVAVALPCLSLAGFAVAGRDAAAAIGPGATSAMATARAHRPDTAGEALLGRWTWMALAAFALPLAAIGGVALMRRLDPVTGAQVQIAYAGGPVVRGPVGATLLEISRMRQVPHTSVCGGRARCSTCRVRIDQGGETLPPPLLAEAVTLGSVGAAADVRLACQIRPVAPLRITRLVGGGLHTGGPNRISDSSEAAGVERHLAVMFLDVRGYTRLSERRLPYDVVFLLNQFFGAVGTAIQAEGGWIDKYLGDGLLAVFGRDSGPEAGCRQALAAARAIDLALDTLNAQLAEDIGEQLAIGIGIHSGVLVVGRIGHADTATITVIGGTVNAASRLESLTKDKGIQLIVSRATADTAGWAPWGLQTDRIAVRGLNEPLDVILVPRARLLPLIPSST